MKELWLSLSLVVCLGAGCSHQADSHRWVHSAREANRQADLALEKNDHRKAVASLRNIVEAGVPDDVAESDARAVRQDACFRLASIELEAQRPGEALRWSDRGLKWGQSNDLFTANLLVVRGHALHLQGREAEAVRDYHQALIINEDLLDRALGPSRERKLP